MKRIFTITLIMMALTACTTLNGQKPEPTATDIPQVAMPNPASVYCTENGNKLEIQTASDGSQFGVCVFPDGSTCDEWAYFKGECGLTAQQEPTPGTTIELIDNASGGGAGGDASGGYMPPGTTEEITGWWGLIKSTEPGAQYDDYFERQDLGQVIYFGIDSLDPAVQAQIDAFRDSGKIVNLYGILLSNVPDYNGSQIQVNRIEEQASGGYMPPGTSESIVDWWGVIESTESGAQYDDYFERQDLGQVIYFGIDSMDPAVQAQIKAVRDSGKIVHLYGTLYSNVPDYNGSQIQVDRIEIVE
jgi:putative hemolysin